MKIIPAAIKTNGHNLPIAIQGKKLFNRKIKPTTIIIIPPNNF